MTEATGSPILVPGILAGLKVIDLSQGLAASVCAMLLAEAGADVVLIEPVQGDVRRGTPQFATWNRSKSVVALDWRDNDMGALMALIAGADILVHDLLPSDARKHGLDAASLARLAPALMVCTVGGYPEGHRHEDMPVDDFLVLAQAGILDEQPAMRRDGPAYIAFPLGSWGAAWLAAIGAMASLHAAQRGHPTANASTSLLQGGLAHSMTHWRMAEKPSASLATGWPKGSPNSIFRCSDGIWLHVMGAPDRVPLMRAELDRLGADEVTRLNLAVGFDHMLFPNFGANIAGFAAHPSTAWLEALWSSDIAVQPVLEPGELYFDQQVQTMAYAVEIDDPELGAMLQPSPAIGISPPIRIGRPQSTWGEQSPGWTTGNRPRASGEKPLVGLRVLDFGQHLAGPYGAMLMADLGADVIKIESPGGDGMRPHEWAFAGCQRGKRALSCDLKNPAAAELIATLVKDADVVMHNLRLPAATRLGLDYDRLKAINPQLIYTHCSAYGPRGARKDWPGYDQLFQALSGWEIYSSGEGNPPDWLRFGMMDHQCAMSSVFATLLALIEREKTGRGQSVNASLLGAALFTTAGALLVRPDGEIGAMPAVDADQTGISPGRRLHQCADGWLALVADDAALARLEESLVVGDAGSLAAAFLRQEVNTAIAAVNEAGGIAVPARTNAAAPFLTDPENIEQGLVARYPHRHYGELTQPGGLLSIGGIPMVGERAPSILGEHSREIMTDIGYTVETQNQLIEGGIVVQAV